MMLYHYYELQRMAMQPMRAMASGALSFLDMPENLLGQTAMGRVTVAALDKLRAHDPPVRQAGASATPTPRSTVRPWRSRKRVALHLPWCDLLHFRRDAHRPGDPTLLIVAPMSGHYATLLRGTVEAFLPDHEVYITDWHNAKDMPLTGPRLRPG